MLRPAFRLMRPGDWAKNAFVLIAPVFAIPSTLAESQAGEALPAILPIVTSSLLAVAAFCLLCSGFYCVNDVLDAEEDRHHPRKKRRPVASGAITPGAATSLGLGLVVAGLTVGFLVSPGLGVILVIYAAMQVLYNLALKRIAVVDVVTIAMGFGLRAAAGALAIEVGISVWLVLCVFFLCLFLGLIKRRADLTVAAKTGAEWTSRAGYTSLAEVDGLVGCAAVLSLVTYLMYCVSTHTRAIFGSRAVGLALLVPLVVVTMHRFYRRAEQGLSDSPLDALREDRGILLATVAYFAGVVACLYVPGVGELLGRIFFLAVMDETS